MTTISRPTVGPAASPTGFLPRLGEAVRGLVRGRPVDAAWVRPAQLGVVGPGGRRSTSST